VLINPVSAIVPDEEHEREDDIDEGRRLGIYQSPELAKSLPLFMSLEKIYSQESSKSIV
jgi:hypothetical protein